MPGIVLDRTFNDKTNLASIYSPEIALGAMLGKISVRVPTNLETGEQVGPTTTFFSEGGKLIHPHLKIPVNTTVSAVKALEKLGVVMGSVRPPISLLPCSLSVRAADS
jgi:hypothetical protein